MAFSVGFTRFIFDSSLLPSISPPSTPSCCKETLRKAASLFLSSNNSLLFRIHGPGGFVGISLLLYFHQDFNLIHHVQPDSSPKLTKMSNSLGTEQIGG